MAQMALASSALRAPLTQRGSLGPLRDLLYDSRLGRRRQLLEHFQAPEQFVESHVSAQLRGEHRPWGYHRSCISCTWLPSKPFMRWRPPQVNAYARRLSLFAFESTRKLRAALSSLRLRSLGSASLGSSLACEFSQRGCLCILPPAFTGWIRLSLRI